MNAYRTIDPTARIEQLEGENAVLRLKVDALAEALAMSVGEDAGKAIETKKESRPMPMWKKLAGVFVTTTIAAGVLAQNGKDAVAIAFAVIAGVALLALFPTALEAGISK